MGSLKCLFSLGQIGGQRARKKRAKAALQAGVPEQGPKWNAMFQCGRGLAARADLPRGPATAIK
ncbi:MAG: hypothetical protein Q8Q80_02470 [Methyloversatilis sp.]|jgi:hypothetical protein|uniref:hypothetical protein n=1 Tax=Methyloversatilis sp. TaxID=2569862 RepID=UPI002734AFE5|nr:hypothetical protein [Methyloversatilis sp.]MDP3871500.1 hypothetical protein [Methyloversatilis sp.]